MFPVEEPKTHDSVVLHLKADAIFPTNQTPTPTDLYKNCEEYGIFEDLKHVNPFDEIFRHAVEEKTGIVTTTEKATTQKIHDEESLHTPQVFPESANSDLTTPPTITELVVKDTGTISTGDKPAIKKYRTIVEKPPTVANEQFLTVNFCDSPVSIKPTTTTCTAIPVQTVKPLILPSLSPKRCNILPKVDTRLKQPTSASINRAPTCTVTSPSSASLTPTSQLPIKERLKVILNNNKSRREIPNANELSRKPSSTREVRSIDRSYKYDERCMERRRAAASRYRSKMRNEYKELKRRNAELQTENEKLRGRLSELEQKQPAELSSLNTQLQIPPSSIHLIMNIPKLVVPAHGGTPMLHNPITYSVEKK